MTTAETIMAELPRPISPEPPGDPASQIIYVTGPSLSTDPVLRNCQAAAYGSVAQGLADAHNAVVICGPTHWVQFFGDDGLMGAETKDRRLRQMRAAAHTMVRLELPGWQSCQDMEQDTAWAERNGVAVETITLQDAGVDPSSASRLLRAATAPDQFEDFVPGMVQQRTASYRAVISTDAGVMIFDLDAKNAPVGVGSFIYLAQQGHYDGCEIVTIVPNLLAQTGNPAKAAVDETPYVFPREREPLPADPGSLGLARSGDGHNGQWFVVTGDQMDRNADVSIVGSLNDGEEALQAINDWTLNGEGPEPFHPQKPLRVHNVRIDCEWQTTFTKVKNSAPAARTTAAKRTGKQTKKNS